MSKAPASVIVYTGLMFEAGGNEEAALEGRIAAALDELGMIEAFGPLACGADILIAEAVLKRGGRLEIVLPFAEHDFIAESVKCGGDAWLPRYHECREQASRVHFSTPSAYVGDDNQFAYNTRFAMGLAALRAAELGAEAIQLAVNSPSARSYSRTGLAGTAADIGIWERLGKRTVTVDAGPVGRNLAFPERPKPFPGTQRDIRSILFADYKGFSRLSERELPVFMREVMGRLGRALDDFGSHVEFRNTWGDALYAIIDQPVMAARVALELQEQLRNVAMLPTESAGATGMRIGLHFGPIYFGNDPITRSPLWYGGEVNRTARIEPVTAVGDVYCTEQFAAALYLDGGAGCSLVRLGERPLAKGFGEVTLFCLVPDGKGAP